MAKKSALTASTADKHVLYEASVQCPSADIAFIQRLYRKKFARLPLSLREDFCGTALLCAEWVKTHSKRVAWGIDLDKKTLRWGTNQHLSALEPSERERVHLLCQNVIDPVASHFDVAVAFNFSYCALKTRADMLAYYRSVYRSLNKQGLFYLDVHGGNECFTELEESTKRSGFTYVWDQSAYEPITGAVKRAIHFRFSDGSEMHNAFTYAWRMWTMPELIDILAEVGFSSTECYWEGDDGKGGGNGRYRRVKKAPNDLSWVSYLVAIK